jgi:hypothetical protein
MKQAKNIWKRIDVKSLKGWKEDFGTSYKDLGVIDVDFNDSLNLEDLNFLYWACNKCDCLVVLSENEKVIKFLEHMSYVDFIYPSKSLEDFSNVEYPTLYLARNKEDVSQEVNESQGFRVDTYE